MKSRKFALLIFSLMIIPNVGCQCWYNVRDSFYYCEPIDEAIHSYNCHRAAKRAWSTRYDRFCERERLDHFGEGFRAGYADVAMGGTGCPPPLPPRRYWGWRYQNCDGQQCVASWFDGYPAGARAAEEDGVANWSRMQTSYIIDAQYAARMPGARRGGPLPPVGGFPGEEVLEEVPASAPTSAPGTTVPAPAEAPSGSFAPEAEGAEEVGVIRDLEKTPPAATKVIELPKIVKRPEIVSAPTNAEPVAEQPVVEPIEETPIPAEEVSEAVATAAPALAPIRHLDAAPSSDEIEATSVRKFEMPAVEMLSGVSVPKKQDAGIEEVKETEVAEAEPEATEDANEEASDDVKPALVRTPALAPIVAPVTPSSAPPVGGIVEETPGYTLGSNEEPSDVKNAPVASPVSTKKMLPPIVPAKPKKQAPPIVRPVEEQGRFTKVNKALPAKQVSYESDELEEVPGLRRIGKTK